MPAYSTMGRSPSQSYLLPELLRPTEAGTWKRSGSQRLGMTVIFSGDTPAASTPAFMPGESATMCAAPA